MLSETIRLRLTGRFAAPLSEFHERRIIFWYDEEAEFEEEADSFELEGVKFVRVTGSNNFAVKKMLLVDDPGSNYLVYLPFGYEKPQDNWLLDIELYSETFRADLVSIQMDELNIASAPELRKTVKLYAKFLESKERKEKLRKIGRDYQAPLQLHVDIMAVLCGLNGGSAQDVIIAVLAAGLDEDDNKPLANIEKFGNVAAFWQLIQKYTGFVNTGERPLWNLAAHILMTASSQTLPASSFKGIERFVSDSTKLYSYQLIHEWQHSEKKEYLLKICRSVERELRLAERFDRIDVHTLAKCDIFPAVDESIIGRFLLEINNRAAKAEDILKVVELRRTVAWNAVFEEYYKSLYSFAKMQEFHVAHSSGFHTVEPKAIWRAYCTDYFVMDTYYRHFHASFTNTPKEPNSLLEDSLKKATEVVEGLYREWYLKELLACWTCAIEDDLANLGYVSEIPRQSDFYRQNVRRDERTFVIISDALRYEVAAELTEKLSHEMRGKATLESMQAIFPSITKFGMAALLPGKKISAEYKNEKLEVLIDGASATSTEKRDAVLCRANEKSVAVLYSDLLHMKKQERRDLVSGKEVVYIYHNTIDAVGDKSVTESKVFEACETAIAELSGITRIVVNDLSGTNIRITADHGFLYTYHPLEESQKIGRQAFDGGIYELGRRYALADEKTSADYLLPVKTSNVIAGLPMQGYTPQDIVRIKIQGGGQNYVHGGISLQELVVPVITYKNLRAQSKHFVEVTNPGVALISESRKVSNLIFSLDFLQKQPVGDKVQSCTYTLCFIDEDGVPVSDTHLIIADRTSTNTNERVFRVRFNLKSMAFDRNKTYRLYMSNDTDVPEEVEFHIDIAFADDFGFDL